MFSTITFLNMLLTRLPDLAISLVIGVCSLVSVPSFRCLIRVLQDLQGLVYTKSVRGCLLPYVPKISLTNEVSSPSLVFQVLSGVGFGKPSCQYEL